MQFFINEVFRKAPDSAGVSYEQALQNPDEIIKENI